MWTVKPAGPGGMWGIFVNDTEFYWDWEAQEVRNADRSLWLRRAQMREGMYGRGVRPEQYGVFRDDGFSIGFTTSTLPKTAPYGSDDPWERTEDGRAIAPVIGLTDVTRFDPIADRMEELGPFKPTHRRFQSLEQQEQILGALAAMLTHLPEAFNKMEHNRNRAAGRIGYELRLDEKFSSELLAGVMIDEH